LRLPRFSTRFALLLLFLVLTPLGVEVNGQQAWVRLPIVGQFQPSEFAKVPTVLMLAKYFGNQKVGIASLKEAMVGAAILAGPVGLIMLEPDAGQAMTYFPILACRTISYRRSRSGTLSVRLYSSQLRSLIPTAYIAGVQTGVIKRYQQEAHRWPFSTRRALIRAGYRIPHRAVNDHGRKGRPVTGSRAKAKLRRAY
jgi:cell division protein FtsW (lipid II flippase)